ncbi:hypothetical protein KBI23_27595 [bacterium]|nr:hypothetical protein [bacterium]MBP9810920.1 hypothetical protein [bacterium]
MAEADSTKPESEGNAPGTDAAAKIQKSSNGVYRAGDAAASDAAAKPVLEPPPQEAGNFPRRAGLANLYLAIKHINDASVAENVKQRFSDYVTIILVIMCILSLVMAVSVPVSPVLKLLPLLFTVGSVVFYIINRLGIMISLTARQALIVWQILVAGFWLGVTSAMLVMLACFYFVSQGGPSGI